MMDKTCRNDSVGSERLIVFLILPFLTGLTVFKIWPLISVIRISFLEGYSYLKGSYNAVSLENYRVIFHDRTFLQALKNTSVYTITVVSSVILLSLVIAWCLLRIRRGLALFQICIFLPFLTSDIAIGMVWRVMFSNHGVVNSLISRLNLNAIGWLTDAHFSLLTLILLGIWNGIPSTVLILYSSMLNIDEKLLTAARLNGAGEFKILGYIVVPAIWQSIIMVFSVNCISALLTVHGLFSLFSGLPGPYYNLYTLTYYVYDKAQQGKYGFAYACAGSCVLLVLVILFLGLRYLLIPKRRKDLMEKS